MMFLRKIQMHSEDILVSSERLERCTSKETQRFEIIEHFFNQKSVSCHDGRVRLCEQGEALLEFRALYPELLRSARKDVPGDCDKIPEIVVNLTQ